LAHKEHEGDLPLRCRARLTAKLAALAGEGFIKTRCPEHDDERFARLLPDAKVLLQIPKPLTKATSIGPRHCG
jgi:hypothetical protein